MVVFCWFVGAVLVSVVAAGAASAQSESSPRDLSAVVSDGSVVVSWTAPAGDVNEYQVYRRAAS